MFSWHARSQQRVDLGCMQSMTDYMNGLIALPRFAVPQQPAWPWPG